MYCCVIFGHAQLSHLSVSDDDIGFCLISCGEEVTLCEGEEEIVKEWLSRYKARKSLCGTKRTVFIFLVERTAGRRPL